MYVPVACVQVRLSAHNCEQHSPTVRWEFLFTDDMKKTVAIVGKSMPEAAVNKLTKEYTVFVIPPDVSVAPEVFSHPDMILTVFDGKLFCHESYTSEIIPQIAELCGLKVVYCRGKRSEKYPEDVAFNVLSVGDKLIGRQDSVAPELREYGIIDTRQGYAGCTSLFAAGHVISADPAILSSAAGAGIPTVRISGEGIELPGYSTGFIGGACGVCGDKIYICGEPNTSPAGRDLQKACRELGLRLISLCGGPVTDVGGIKFLPYSVEKSSVK